MQLWRPNTSLDYRLNQSYSSLFVMLLDVFISSDLLFKLPMTVLNEVLFDIPGPEMAIISVTVGGLSFKCGYLVYE